MDEIDDLEVADRVRRVQRHLGYETDEEFARALGVTKQRINNVLRGSALGRDLAVKMVRRVPGLSVDWLWFGNASGMPVGLATELGVLTPPAARTASRVARR
jgi:transcriptional regulator with XRE-family HTH domain